MDIYTEVTFNTIYTEPTNADMTENTLNGIDQLNTLFPYEKSMIFKSSFDNADKLDNSKPTIAPPVKFSFNAAIVSIGIRKWLR